MMRSTSQPIQHGSEGSGARGGSKSRRRRWRGGAGVALALSLVTMGFTTGTAAADAPLKPGHGRVVQDQYIVRVTDGTNAAAVASRNGITTRHVYGSTISGFSATMNRAQLSKIRKDSAVLYVEPNSYVTVSDAKPNPPAQASDSTPPSALKPTSGGVSTESTQTGATWGIDRIDQPTGINTTYNYTDPGQYVSAYVIDTGIYTAHNQFLGRAVVGFDAFGGNGQDCNGHGTHVAGTIGGWGYGVAKKVRLVAVRVLDCGGSGSFEGVIAGIDWVTAVHNGPSVANMSLGGGYHQATNDAVARSIARGVTHVVAAGNSNDNACNYSPSSAPGAITVAATDYSGGTDFRASFSNWGSCVDVFDPGVNIKSAWIGSTTATNTISGTSMASPHVAGQVALYLQGNVYATPATVDDVIKTVAIRNIVSDPAGPTNLFARKWNGYLSGTGASQYQPDGTYWYQANAGYILGWLAGTAGTDPDLYLQKWNGSTWVTVAGSASVTPRERIVYSATGASYYRFQIYAFNGSGTYDVWSSHPD